MGLDILTIIPDSPNLTLLTFLFFFAIVSCCSLSQPSHGMEANYVAVNRGFCRRFRGGQGHLPLAGKGQAAFTHAQGVGDHDHVAAGASGGAGDQRDP